MMKKIHHILYRYRIEKAANALVETAVLFPVFLTLLMGVYDIGQGLVVNQKSIKSSQIVADLIARNREVDFNTVNDILRAGRMAIEPYDTTPYGYDIVSVIFDEDGDPIIQWRMTDNMLPNNDPLQDAQDILELENQGLVIVTTAYTYTPLFSGFLVDEIRMQEVAFLRGRGSSFVQCEDCPGGV